MGYESSPILPSPQSSPASQFIPHPTYSLLFSLQFRKNLDDHLLIVIEIRNNHQKQENLGYICQSLKLLHTLFSLVSHSLGFDLIFKFDLISNSLGTLATSIRGLIYSGPCQGPRYDFLHEGAMGKRAKT